MRFGFGAGLAVLAALSLALGPGGAEAVEPEGQFVSVTGGRLHVVVLESRGKPSGSTLLLLHGASGNLKDLQESIGERLAARHRVILVDRPGHGHSDRLGGREMSSPARQADAISEALERLKVGRAVVVGHSWSGALATNLALDHPSHVSGLVLISPGSHPYPGGAAWYNEIAATPLIGRAFASLIRPVAEKRFDDGLKSVFAPKPPPPDYVARTDAKLLLRPEEFVANAEDLVDFKRFVAAQYRRYDAIRVPTVIITADKDEIVSPEIHSRPLHRQIKGSKLVVLEGVGHTPHWNATDRVIREIEGVVAKAR
ncbi:alpha/beta hydrolase [Methylopila sp. M107]|uniref:alpha/beta fold hydrolase n=1 Tax=Methylopila sp. M107 TaxID=1101190 RepID=UPI000375F2FE|nr:alpha/beta hydrolase [Methylopila sp. M107]